MKTHINSLGHLWSSRKRNRLIIILLLLVAFILYWQSGLLGISSESVRDLSKSPWTAAIIILAMTGAWTFALPASVFFFITPSLYDPGPSTLIITIGTGFGTLSGYIAARQLGGPWVEKYKTHKVTAVLKRHSNFSMLFAIRIVPGSPHGFINYGAGLVSVPILRFITATILATSIKAFIYSLAVHSATTATSIRDALNWESIAALFGLAILALAGRYARARWNSRLSGPDED